MGSIPIGGTKKLDCPIAQLVACLFLRQKVFGSSPNGTTKQYGLCNPFMETDRIVTPEKCKSFKRVRYSWQPQTTAMRCYKPKDAGMLNCSAINWREVVHICCGFCSLTCKKLTVGLLHCLLREDG